MFGGRQLTELTMEHLKAKVPAAFATGEKESLSDKYLYIPTFEIINGLMKEGFKPVDARMAGSRKGSSEHSKHVISFTHGSIQDLEAREGTPLIRIENSHNGLSSFQVNAGFYRLVCSNGLIMPDSSIANSRIRHVKGMEGDVIEASYRIIEEMPKQMELMNLMKTIELNHDEKMILAESAVNLQFEEDVIQLNKDKRNDLREKLLRPNRTFDKNNDLWSVFNAIQENSIRGGYKMYTQSPTKDELNYAKKRAVNSIDMDKKINQELMALAQKMAELKAA